MDDNFNQDNDLESYPEVTKPDSLDQEIQKIFDNKFTKKIEPTRRVNEFFIDFEIEKIDRRSDSEIEN